MNRQKATQTLQRTKNATNKKYITSMSSLQQVQLQHKPSKKAQLQFIKKLKKYRKKYPYLTEDQESSFILSSQNDCLQNEGEQSIEQLKPDFKRKLNHQEALLYENIGRKLLKQNQFLEKKEQINQFVLSPQNPIQVENRQQNN